MKTISFVLVFFILSTFLFSTIINVPGDQPTIQEGINVAVDTDTVLVQPDTYIENINYNGKLITVASLFLTTQDTTYISQTIIHGMENGSVITFENGEDSTAILTGFTITNGYNENGGGIYCQNNSSPSLENITLSGNSSPAGGGIYCQNNSSPNLENVTISGNASLAGGGIYCCGGSSPSLENVIISDNSAVFDGGGIYCWDGSSPSLQNVIIQGNSAEQFGGGIICQNNSSPSLENVIISDNSAIDNGGGIYCYSSNPNLLNVSIDNNLGSGGGGGICCVSSSPNLENVIITGNSAYSGGGIYCSDYSNPSLINVIISENSASETYGSGGGIFCCYSSSPIFVNVSIIGNSANEGGGIYCSYDANPNLTNCILWNDSPQEIYFKGDDDPNSITISYSDIQGGEAGIVTNNNGTVNWLEGNIDEDPLFVGTGEHPFSYLEDSPCIDAGIPDTTGLNLPPWDIIGNLRIWDGDENGSTIIDMGAYEYGAPLYVNIDNNVIVQTHEIILQQNYPNPFNPSTTIEYSITQDANVSLNIYNIKGQKVKQLDSDRLLVGQHSVVWNGKDDNGKSVSSGIYFYKLKTENYNQTRKMLLLK